MVDLFRLIFRILALMLCAVLFLIGWHVHSEREARKHHRRGINRESNLPLPDARHVQRRLAPAQRAPGYRWVQGWIVRYGPDRESLPMRRRDAIVALREARDSAKG